MHRIPGTGFADEVQSTRVSKINEQQPGRQRGLFHRRKNPGVQVGGKMPCEVRLRPPLPDEEQGLVPDAGRNLATDTPGLCERRTGDGLQDFEDLIPLAGAGEDPKERENHGWTRQPHVKRDASLCLPRTKGGIAEFRADREKAELAGVGPERRQDDIRSRGRQSDPGNPGGATREAIEEGFRG